MKYVNWDRKTWNEEMYKNNSTLKSTLKILHVLKQLKEDITSDDAA